MSGTFIRKSSPFDYFSRLKKRGQSSFAIESILIAFLVAFTACQIMYIVGAKAGSF